MEALPSLLKFEGALNRAPLDDVAVKPKLAVDNYGAQLMALGVIAAILRQTLEAHEALGRRLGPTGRAAELPAEQAQEPPVNGWLGLQEPLDPESWATFQVGLDSLLHPQTLLAWAMNGSPLAPEHGAPLRLVIPVKYGYKWLKRAGSLRLVEERPRDTWAERGYDWYAGL